MIDLNIKNDEEKVTAEYLLKPNDRIDNLTLGMMVNNDIKGFLKIQPVQVENERYFRYDITGLVTMKEFLGEYVKKDKLLKVFYGIAATIKESSEYMINWTSFSLDRKEIYVNPENGEVKLLCLPLLTVVNDGNICNFFKNVLFSSQFDLDENGDYVGKLINLLNPRSYTLDNFIFELEESLGLEHIEKDVAEDTEDNIAEDVEDNVKEDVVENNEGNIGDDIGDNMEENVEDNIGDDYAESVEDDIIKDDNEDVKEEITTDKEDRQETIQMEIKEVQSDLGAEEKEQSDLPPLVQRPEIEPYLVRLSNNQKIMIDKDVFYIGKDDKDVDYCIAGNSAIDDKHAYIIRHEKEFFVVDNNSKNHTYLNRVLIEADEEIFIPHGSQLSFADEDFEFRMHK